MRAFITAVAAAAALACALTTPYPYQTKRQLAEIEADPTAHQGKLYAFQGRVVSARKTDRGWVVQILTKDSYPTSIEPLGPSLIGVFPSDSARFAEGDHVQLLGYIGQPISGRNAFGGLTSAVTMRVVAARNQTIAYAWWLNEAQSLYLQWEDGTLFAQAR